MTDDGIVTGNFHGTDKDFQGIVNVSGIHRRLG